VYKYDIQCKYSDGVNEITQPGLRHEKVSCPTGSTYNLLLDACRPLATSPIRVLTASVAKLEQVYAKYALGGVQSTGAQTIELSAPTSLTPTTEVVNFVGLARGSSDNRVSSLKAILRTISPATSLGCSNLSTLNTLYGPTTEECVKIFQNLNELEPTGSIDQATNRALNRVITN
jgi:murein L,D-transpeptidase YcbB/YkuD